MPSQNTTPKKPARKPQPRKSSATKKPAIAKAKPAVPEVPAPAPSALFEPVVPAAPVAAPVSETAASGEATAATPFKREVEAAPQGPAVDDEKAEVLSAPAPIVVSSDEPRTVRLGAVSATLLRMPLGEVLIHMDAFMQRLAAVAETKGSLDLQPQMLATEGRCAPIYFIGEPEDGEPEHLFDGIEALAAAVAIGLETVSVIIIAPGDAGAAQNHLAAHRQLTKPADPEEDFLRRVMAYQ